MKWKITTIAQASVCALGLFAVPAQAAPISGILNITGAARVTATSIDWVPLAGVDGTFDITFPGTEYFSNVWQPVSGVNTGDSLDLTAGTPFPIANFLNDFTTPDPEYNDLSFTLEGLVIPALPVCGTPDGSGVAGDQNGESCVAFAGSPFTLTMGADLASTDINFNVFGSFVDLTFGDDGSLNDATGLYTANIAGQTPLAIKAIIDAGGPVDSSYSAQFVATPLAVPEPLALALTGFGLAATAYRIRRRGRRQNGETA